MTLLSNDKGSNDIAVKLVLPGSRYMHAPCHIMEANHLIVALISISLFQTALYLDIYKILLHKTMKKTRDYTFCTLQVIDTEVDLTFCARETK